MRSQLLRLCSILFISAVLVAALTVRPGQAAEAPASTKTRIEVLEPKDAADLIEKNRASQDFVILDVRTPTEYGGGHIPGAINIDYNSPGFKDEAAKLDRAKTYVVYCRTGRRTARAVKIMVELGFLKIYRISGDITAWKSEKLPLTN
jgi:rhodanese-related sulfurtransferase